MENRKGRRGEIHKPDNDGGGEENVNWTVNEKKGKERRKRKKRRQKMA